MRILRARVYSAHHKSFVHRMLAFFSFMVSSFWIGLGLRDLDLVWGTSPPIFQGVTAWLLARLKGARFLFEVRDLWPQFAVAVGVLRNPWLISASEWLERFLYRQADCVDGQQPRLRRARAPTRARDASSWCRTGPTLPCSIRRPMARSSVASIDLDDRFVALYAGAHGMSNDLDVLLDAARLLQDSAIQIVLVGDGKEKPGLVARGEAPGPRERPVPTGGAEARDAGRAGGC